MERKNINSKVTKSMFNAMKILLKSGEPQKNVAEAFGVSKTVVYWVNRSEEYDEYKNNIYQTSGGYRKRIAKEKIAKEETKAVPSAPEAVPEENQSKTTIVVQATHYMMEELKMVNEQLKLMNNKLAFIVDELTK